MSGPLLWIPTRGLGSQVSVLSGPLSGIPFLLRLQSNQASVNPIGLFQDASLTTPSATQNDPVGGWKDDLSTSGIAITNATGVKKGSLNFLAGKPAVLFDGTQQYLLNSSAALPSGNQPWSAFFALTRSNEGAIFAWGSQAAGVDSSVVFYFPVGVFSVLKTNVLMQGPLIPTNTPIIASITYDGTTLGAGLEMWINGVSQTLSGSGGAFNLPVNSNVAVGRWADFDGLYFGGNVFAAMVVGSQVSEATRLKVEAFLPTLLPDNSLVPINIGFIGDSITFGTGPSTVADKPVNFELTALPQNVRTVVGVNRGISNTQSSDWVSGSANLIAAMAAFIPGSWVQVMLGINDAANGVLSAAYISNMTSLFGSLVSSGFKAIISQPTAASDALFPLINPVLSTYLSPLAALANGTTIVLGDQTMFAVFEAHPEYLVDGIHPNDTGGQVLGQAWATAFPL